MGATFLTRSGQVQHSRYLHSSTEPRGSSSGDLRTLGIRDRLRVWQKEVDETGSPLPGTEVVNSWTRDTALVALDELRSSLDADHIPPAYGSSLDEPGGIRLFYNRGDLVELR